MEILDNANMIAQRDTQDALGVATECLDQLLADFNAPQANITSEIKNIVYSGMGGSSLQAEFIKTWPKLKIPYIVSKDYKLPEFVDSSTLVVIASYSGNTEEALFSLEDAIEKGAQIAILPGGGKLLEIAKEKNLYHIVTPKAVQPRMAVFYGFRALLDVLVAHGVVDAAIFDDFEAMVGRLQQRVNEWRKEVVTNDNYAKQIALKLMGKTSIVYAGPLMSPAAYKWKINTNENAKNTAWTNQYPEFNHNEFMGWTSHPIEKPFAVIDLISSYEHPRILKRFEVSDRMLSGMRPKAIQIQAEGESVLEHLMYFLLLSDFVTIYLGLLNGVDPSPVHLIEKFKKELG